MESSSYDSLEYIVDGQIYGLNLKTHDEKCQGDEELLQVISSFKPQGSTSYLFYTICGVTKNYFVGKRTNLQTGVTRKQNTPNVPKNGYFLPPDTRMYQRVRNVHFSENLTYSFL